VLQAQVPQGEAKEGSMKNKCVSVADWEWFGLAGHFICGDRCQFHMTTKVGTVVVSTIGRLLHDEGSREITAGVRGVKLVGKGDARKADYMKKIGFDEVGFGRKFETMVFRTDGVCPCGCGLPSIIPSEIDFDSYNEDEAARLGHLAMCHKWSADKQSEEGK
jgi:hypothetical protein